MSPANRAFGFAPAFLALALGAGDELLGNPTFEDGAGGWSLRGAEARAAGGPDGGPCVALLGTAATGESWTHVGIRLVEPPTERRLSFSAQVISEATGEVDVNAFAYRGRSELLESWTETRPLGEGWTEVRSEYVLPAGTETFTLWVIHAASGELRVADASLQAGDPQRSRPKNLTGAGVIRASANVVVGPAEDGSAGRVLFPIPLLTEHQVPLTFDVVTTPAGALTSFRWVPREDGMNWLAEIEVAPTLPVEVAWESLVLVGERRDAPLPEAPRPEVPDEAAPWLESTACIQSEDPDVVAKAHELIDAGGDVGDFVAGVIAFTSTNQGDGAEFRTLDAASAIHCGGSCTSRANLAAALLRAGGVPARTSAHLPTWSGPLYEHWHVEYWHPGAGWTWVEPTLGKMRPAPFTFVVLNIANPEDEEQGFHPVIAHSGVMLGVPRYSVHELGEGLARPWPLPDDIAPRLNEARAEAPLDGSLSRQGELFERARDHWARLAEQCLAGTVDRDALAAIESALAADEVTEALLDALEHD